MLRHALANHQPVAMQRVRTGLPGSISLASSADTQPARMHANEVTAIAFLSPYSETTSLSDVSSNVEPVPKMASSSA